MADDSTQTSLHGQVEKVVFSNPQNGYTVAKLRISSSRRLVTAVGILPQTRPGQGLRLWGAWRTHPRFGEQFHAQSFEVTAPTDEKGIRLYLGSGIIPGIGPIMAEKLVKAFGGDVLAVMEKEPDRLLEVGGIGPERAGAISGALKSHQRLAKVMACLQEAGVRPDMGPRLLKQYDDQALEVLTQTPYRLARDFPETGFDAAEALAAAKGMAADHPDRIFACAAHGLYGFTSDGHTCVPEEDLIHRLTRRMGLAPEAALAAVDALVNQKEAVRETLESDGRAVVVPASLDEAENGLALRLAAFLSIPPDTDRLTREEMEQAVSRKLAIALSQEQMAVLEGMPDHKLVVITGGPGTGKTTLIRSIMAVFDALGRTVLAASPTGRASRRLAQVTGKKAYTIHRLLGYSPEDASFFRDETNPLEADVIIVDEASMVDTILMYHLLLAVPMTAMLILVGDVFQLPPIGPGNVLSDIIRSLEERYAEKDGSGASPVFTLTEIFRQAGESLIVRNAHRVRAGKFPRLDQLTEPEDAHEFYFFPANTPDMARDMILRLCTDELPRRFSLDPVSDIQVLTPMHKGKAGALVLNPSLQQALNPRETGIKTPFGEFRRGDKVMHLKNNYQKEVFNGDMGIVVDMDESKGSLEVDFEGRPVTYEPEDLDELTLGYAITVHKSQGSEYPAVVIPLMTAHYPLLQRNLLYTAITRGKRLVVLVGMEKAMAIALENNRPQQRMTLLKQRFSGAMAGLSGEPSP